MFYFSRMLLVSTAITALSSAVSLGAAQAQNQSNPFAADRSATNVAVSLNDVQTPSSTLRRFDASTDEFFLSGERTTLTIPFYVTPIETTRNAKFVLALQSAVSVMPETSNLNVRVNGVPVAQTRLGTGKADRVEADLPAGLLQPGFNAIEIMTDQNHRVDCSLPGTYELWTQIDPAASGIDFGLASIPMNQLSDLATIAGVGTDRTRINIVVPTSSPDATQVSQAMAIAQALTIIGNISRPLVTIGPSVAMGPGLDVLLANTGGQSAEGWHTRDEQTLSPGIVYQPGTRETPSRLVLGDGERNSSDRAISDLVDLAGTLKPAGTDTGLAALERRNGANLQANEPVALSDLGLDTSEFSGRFYRSDITFSLPSDFYPADYDRAELTLDAAYAADLSSDASLVINANGRQVTAIPLRSTLSGTIEDQTIKIPLGFMKPGKNKITFQASLLNMADVACDPTVMADLRPRFAIRSTSTLQLPKVAQIGHLPDLALIANGSAYSEPRSDQPLSLLVTDRSAATLGGAATFIARIAQASKQIRPVTLQTGLRDDGQADVLAIGTYATLPSEVLRATGLEDGTAFQSSVSEIVDDKVSLSSGSRLLEPVKATFFASFEQPINLTERLDELRNSISAFFQGTRSAFGRLPGLSSFLETKGFVALGNIPDKATALTVISQAATPGPVPRTWTVVAGPDQNSLSQGIIELTEPSNWQQLQGAAVALAPDGTLVSFAAEGERLFETQPRSVSNLRLVFAGWLSRHLLEYLLGLSLIALLLGLSTRALIGRVGANTK
ncbi:cellulose biosynthesis cyclic di-GMP-binding regulatory protein BcsB [Fulvimarina sp. 2208YS6-2-32]|uniref:Cyclic di-GMP-binding protein n=1 Tax=Fulvimarina uroteuthidis TaxID=3098149 RepID=A0ABU5I6G5_9HYPH|nr:cellulose biosynthesis cyclic di-GMP-binding regulatory protein BcsB [Fulvimarina sp. 2208YS6-2-32]MDY8110801.1 cellulose biosynthesis cyclic di-GMP-binding regulatory protein BcsB [Fulvimarina sp. 2208YS6-2-32]